MKQVKVNRKAADRVAGGHPWIFASDVEDRGSAEPGEAVKVTGPRGRALGTAHYSSTSQICLRMLSSEVTAIDAVFWKARLEAALAFRRRHVTGTSAFRLVHGEGDLLPGLVVDCYGDCLALQALDQGIDRALDKIVPCLKDVLSPKAILARNDVPVRNHEGLPLENRVLWGEPPETVRIEMNGLVLEVSLGSGQKTGTYLDQRENYLAAARFARGRALDCFTSTGGFALQMARQCEHIEAIDSSGPALALARAAAEANGIGNIEWREANVFDVLSGMVVSGRRFDTIVLDPPAFAKSRGALEGAIRGYKEINLRALKLLQPGGVLVTCSCSFHLSEAALLGVVAEAALDAGRTLRVLERRTQSIDHPILLTVPETHYLKCLLLEVV